MNRYFFLFVTIFLSSCTTSAITPTKPVTIASIPIGTPISINITETPSPHPTLTPAPTSTVTLTALPTLTVSEAERFILGLYNNNCLLPCWGGFVPGQASWLKAQQQIQSANGEIEKDYPKRARYGISAEFNIPNQGITFVNFYYVDKGLIYMIRPQVLTKTYDLIPLLLEYGQPDEVWISAYPASGPQNSVPFGIILFYKKGISILYSYSAVVEQDYHTLCPAVQQTELPPMLFVWEPDRYLTLKGFEADTEVFGITIKNNLLYKPLEETTETSIEELYNELLVPSSNYCIKTPKSSW